jgi:hypothetical protein
MPKTEKMPVSAEGNTHRNTRASSATAPGIAMLAP